MNLRGTEPSGVVGRVAPRAPLPGWWKGGAMEVAPVALRPESRMNSPRSARLSTCPAHAVCLALVAAALFLARSAFAQSYSLDWFTLDGGGGTSTGGVYSVSGSIGQPDAGGPLTNGQYSVTGGFWALPTAVQVIGAPTLTIAPAAAGQATISWTPNTPGFVLQETLSLSPTNWVNSASGATNPIVVPATLPTKFYRLFKP